MSLDQVEQLFLPIWRALPLKGVWSLGSVGRLSAEEGPDIEWKIPQEILLSPTVRPNFDSPHFSFLGSTWHFRMYPNHKNTFDPINTTEIRLVKANLGPPILLTVTLRIESGNGFKQTFGPVTRSFDTGYTISMSRSSVTGIHSSKSSDLGESEDFSESDDLEEPEILVDLEESDEEGFEEMEDLEEPEDTLPPPVTFTVICHLDDQNVIPGNLPLEFRQLELLGENSDVTLNVQGTPFRCHRNILEAKSSVLSAIMRRQLNDENSDRIVNLENSDPDTFPQFLKYLYSGTVYNLTLRNVHSLYATANRYKVQELETVCLTMMTENITIHNFWGVLGPVIRNQDRGLILTAGQFFMDNAEILMSSGKWKSFLIENVVITGNELIERLMQKRNSEEVDV